MDAGAHTTSAVRIVDSAGGRVFDGTPMALTTRSLREKKTGRTKATEEQLHRLDAIQRLLVRVEAVHAVSWLWPYRVPCIVRAAVESESGTKVAPAPLTLMLPMLRRRARRPRVLLAALLR